MFKMKVIDRYIAKTVITDTLLVLVSLMLLRSLFAFIDQSNDIGKGDYQFIDALYFATLQLPATLYELFPVSALIGGLLGIGRLATNSELVILRASGLSLAQISQAVLKGTIALMLIVFLIGEFITPKSSQLARQMQTLLISGGSLVKSPKGVWVKEDDSYINIRIILPNGQLEGLTQFKYSNKQLHSMIYAQSANYQQDGQWLLKGIKQTFIDNEAITSAEADLMYWETKLTPETLGVVSLKPEDLNIKGLYDYSAYLQQNGLNSTRYDLAFWNKLFQPIAVAVMMFLALSFISGPLRTVTIGARIVLGMIVGYGFNMLASIFGPVSLIYQMPAILAASLPIIIFAVIAAFMLKQAR